MRYKFVHFGNKGSWMIGMPMKNKEYERKIICIEYSEGMEAFLESEGIGFWVIEILELMG